MAEYYSGKRYGPKYSTFPLHEAKAVSQMLCNDLTSNSYQRHKEPKEFTTYYPMLLNYKEHLNQYRAHLNKFCLTFLEMVEILLNLIYATRSGYWDLLLKAISMIIPYISALWSSKLLNCGSIWHQC